MQEENEFDYPGAISKSSRCRRRAAGGRRKGRRGEWEFQVVVENTKGNSLPYGQ
jgi:hypothetical protein